MKKLIVSDTTTLITLQKQQRLNLLCQLFDRVYLPQAVYQELSARMPESNPLKQLPCFCIQSVSPSKQLQALRLVLDKGEAEAIEMAKVKRLSLLIDEKKGRKVAARLDIPLIGFAGLLILAKHQAVLDRQQALSLLETGIKNGHRLSNALYQQIILKLEQ